MSAGETFSDLTGGGHAGEPHRSSVGAAQFFYSIKKEGTPASFKLKTARRISSARAPEIVPVLKNNQRNQTVRDALL